MIINILDPAGDYMKRLQNATEKSPCSTELRQVPTLGRSTWKVISVYKYTTTA
jgi:hypothetical protein